jgi:hypothetical protein
MAGSILDNVDVHDAGDKIILASDDEETLAHVVEEMMKEGVRGIQRPVKVGHRWIASFEHPDAMKCKIEKNGFEIVIKGPSESGVMMRSQGFRERGALVVRGPELEDGEWKLYLDDAGKRTGNIISG